MARRKVQRNHCRCFPTGFAEGLNFISIVVFVIVFIIIIVIVFVIVFIIAFIISISSLITIMITVYFGRNGLPPSRPHHWICPSSSQTHFPTLTFLHFRDFYFKHHHEPGSIFGPLLPPLPLCGISLHRLFLAPNPRECYICYHDSAPQVIVVTYFVMMMRIKVMMLTIISRISEQVPPKPLT